MTDARLTSGRPTSGPPIVLIGPMGAGKTRIGKRVARILGTGFLDTDRMIVAENGPVADIFDAHGEPHFRAVQIGRASCRERVYGLV